MEQSLSKVLRNAGQLDDVNNFIVYSDVSNHLYLLYSIRDNHYILSAKIEEDKIASTKTIQLALPRQRERKFEQLTFEGLSINPSKNQLCLEEARHLFFISDVSKDLNSSNLTLSPTHSFNNTDDLIFKFSPFEDYFGVLNIKTQIFYYYSIDSRIPKATLALNERVVDFSFGNKNQRGLEMFYVYFLGEKGDISVSGPVFPENFAISRLQLVCLKSYFMSKLVQKKGDEDRLKFCCAIVNEIERCKDDDKETPNKGYLNIKLNQNLQTLNQSLTLRKLLVQGNEDDKAGQLLAHETFKELLLIADDKLVTFLKLSEKNRISVVISIGDLLPLNFGKMNFNNVPKEDNRNFLLEIIDLNTEFPSKEKVKFFLTDNAQNEAIIQVNGFLFQIQIPYLSSINDILNYKYEKLLSLNGNHSKVREIIKPSANKRNKYGIVFIDNEKRSSLLLITSEKNVKEIKLEKFEQEEKLKELYMSLPEHKKVQGKIDEFVCELKRIEFLSSEIDQSLMIKLPEGIFSGNEYNNAIEGLILEQLEKLTSYYEKILGTNYDIYLQRIQLMNNYLEGINNSEIIARYENIQKKMEMIKTKIKEFQENNKLINKKFSELRTEINLILTEDKETNSYLTYVETFYENLRLAFIKIKSNFASINEGLKKLQRGNFTNFYIEGMKYKSSNLLPEYKEKLKLFEKQIEKLNNKIN